MDWSPLTIPTWRRNCFDSNPSEPGCRRSIRPTYCRTGDYGHTLYSRSLYSASRVGMPPCSVMRLENRLGLCSLGRCGRSPLSMRSCWSWLNSVSLTSYTCPSSYEARMGDSWNLAGQSWTACLLMDSDEFPNCVFLSCVALSISGGLESISPMGSSESLGQRSLSTFCSQCLWRRSRMRPSKFKCQS